MNLRLALPLAFVLGSCATTGTGPTAIDATSGALSSVELGGRFKPADDLMAKGSNEAATAKYAELVDADPKDDHADQALINAAVCAERLQRTDLAQKFYERIAATYPQSRLAPAALFRIAVNAENSLEFDKAIHTYQQLAREHPKAVDREAALLYTIRLLEGLRRNVEAAEVYLTYAEAFPRSEDAPRGLLRAAEIYDQQPDYKAELLALDTFVRDYRDDPAQAQRIVEAKKRIAAAQGKLEQGPEAGKTAAAATTSSPDKKGAKSWKAPGETHFSELRQLTFGGENAEAYWSFDGTQLTLQARGPADVCDKIYTMAVFDDPPNVTLQSSGKGATTCSHFFPGDKELLYASTHLGGDACPPKPDMSLGYVWALYDTYDIFKKNLSTGALEQLTTEKGYDAEATVCAKDGSIVFTSTRDGDIELYRMDKDGKNVKRLTFEPGYDGGAFFNRDCSKLVWRASRPKPGKELDDFRALLAKGLVRPTKLELYVGNADGSDARQITYLNAASFAPFWHPTRDRILFSSNSGDPKGREFDIWAINADGTGLEQITQAKGFDGFPMFSPDGKWLAFSSNRATAEGKSDTNVFLAKWLDHTPKSLGETGAERIKADVEWLAAPEREGRGIGTPGLEASGAYLEGRLQAAGLTVERDPFPVVTAVTASGETALKLGKAGLAKTDFAPFGWSGQGVVKAKAVLAGYGLEDSALGFDDYKGLNVKGKVVVVRRFIPDSASTLPAEDARRAGDLRKKAFTARNKGAVALLVVDWPLPPKGAPGDWKPPPEAKLPELTPETGGDAGLPVFGVSRKALEAWMPKLAKKKPVDVELNLKLVFQQSDAFNVVGKLAGTQAGTPPLFIGAHYDHLGYGGRDSLAPDKHEPHLGADDNASGVAAVLELARLLKAAPLSRDVYFVLFAGEETGDLGSAHFVKAHPALLKGAPAMLNLDMVGRMRGNALTVLGVESAEGWRPLIDAACEKTRLVCTSSGDGYGPSDHTPFYAEGLPVLHFFTGAHSDYHKPSDTAAKLNAGGTAQVALTVLEVARAVDAPQTKLTYKKLPPQTKGDARNFGASLGTVPDYGGPPNGQKGVLLSDVRPGGGADKGGMKKGDILVKLGKTEVRGVEDLMFVLMQAKPGESVTAVVLREGREVPLEVTFQEGRKR